MSVADVVMVPFLFAAGAALVWVVFGTARDVYMISEWRRAMIEFDAEYWPRRYAKIEAQRQYRDIPARLDQWQKERAT